MMTTYPTPIEMKTPDTKDHGLLLVHDMDGAERDLLHEVSVKGDDAFTAALMTDRGYRRSHGYVKAGRQWWVWTKAYPLGMREWRD